MTRAFLALGSNIEPEKNILEAVKLLSKRVRIVDLSTVYLTQPLLGKSQPDFYNCVVKIETDIEPHRLEFDVLRAVEEELGRKRTKDRYEARTIDIDLILYGDSQLSDKDMVLPDPQISERPFLAIPLFEIEPRLLLPGADKPIKEIADKFKNHRMVPLREYTNTLRNLVASLVK